MAGASIEEVADELEVGQPFEGRGSASVGDTAVDLVSEDEVCQFSRPRLLHPSCTRAGTSCR